MGSPTAPLDLTLSGPEKVKNREFHPDFEPLYLTKEPS